MDNFSKCLRYHSCSLERAFHGFLASLEPVQSQDQSHSQSANLGSKSRVRHEEILAQGQDEAILMVNLRKTDPPRLCLEKYHYG